MRPFRRFAPTSLEEAAALMRDLPGRAALMAGGTDLLGTMKDDIHQDYPSALVDLKGIPGMRSVRIEDGELRVGALALLADLAADPAVRERCGLVAAAAAAVASSTIRRMGTVGGNLCQEPRCWYYRYPGNLFFCIRKGGTHCDALLGQNAIHSVFGAAKVGPRPCQSFCPNGNAIPEYLARIRSGDIPAAAGILLASNPLAAITGRVCPHFCQEKCSRMGVDGAVSIPELERHIGDHLLENGEKYFTAPPSENGRSAAIVGAGPAGLGAAFFLRALGFAVTVYDRNPLPGGMLLYGIPPFRLPRSVVQDLAGNLERMGIVFRMNVELGRDVSLTDLRAGADAVFLAPGAWGSRPLGVPGEDLAVHGLEFLRGAGSRSPELGGKKVAVVGGGNVAMDCARTAVRLGAAEVHVLYRRTEAEMPAYPEERKEARAEGVQFRFLVQPAGIRPTGGGRMALALSAMELGRPDQSGRRSVRPVPQQLLTDEFDTIIAAVGQQLEAGLAGLNPAGFLEADQDTFQTAEKGVYAGGDAAIWGPRTIVEALHSGRKAAEAIARSFGIAGPPQEAPGAVGVLSWSQSALTASAPFLPQQAAPAARDLLHEDALPMDGPSAAREAERCLNCGCIAVCSSDLAPALVALEASIVTTRRTVEARRFFAARRMAGTVLEKGEIVTEVRVPLPPDGGPVHGAWHKHSIRKAIDFPRASVAVALRMDGDTVGAARIVFGGVAPVPWEASAAQGYLAGKRLSPEAIAEACRLAVEGCQSLRHNGYKVPVLKKYLRMCLEELA